MNTEHTEMKDTNKTDGVFKGEPMDANEKDISMEEQEEKAAEKHKKSGKKNRKVWYVLLCTGLSLLFFFIGGISFWFALDEDMRTLIKIKTAIDREYYKEIDDDLFYGEIFKAVNNEVLDDYSRYMTEEEYAATKKARTGSSSGAGLSFLTQDKDGNPQMYILSVLGNSPAEERGMLAGDYIVGFGETKETVKDSVIFDDFSAFLKERKDDEEFYVKVKRGEEEKSFALYKSAYVENYVFYRTKEKAYSFTGDSGTTMTERGLPLACLDEETAYIRLTYFNGNAAKNFKNAMQRFKADGKKNLVLDLRGNGGGYMDILEDIASYFCKNSKSDTPVVAVADYGTKKEKFKAKTNAYDFYFAADSRIMVLADCNTASASEALMGCMIDYGATRYEDICLSERNGVVRTYGKGIMQTTFPVLINDGAIKLTTAEIKWPVSGNCIHGRGILPEDGTKTVEQDYAADAEITAAIERLKLN